MGAEAVKGRTYWRWPIVILVFRLQLRAGPCIPIIMRRCKICRLPLVMQRSAESLTQDDGGRMVSPGLPVNNPKSNA